MKTSGRHPSHGAQAYEANRGGGVLPEGAAERPRWISDRNSKDRRELDIGDAATLLFTGGKDTAFPSAASASIIPRTLPRKFDSKSLQLFATTRVAMGMVYYRPVHDGGDREGLGSRSRCPVEDFDRRCLRPAVSG
jgi:hypothetical protein